MQRRFHRFLLPQRPTRKPRIFFRKHHIPNRSLLQQRPKNIHHEIHRKTPIHVRTLQKNKKFCPIQPRPKISKILKNRTIFRQSSLQYRKIHRKPHHFPLQRPENPAPFRILNQIYRQLPTHQRLLTHQPR